MKGKTRWEQIRRAIEMRTSNLVCIGKRDERGVLHATVVEPEDVEITLKAWGEGAFVCDWGIEPKEM